MPNPILFVNSSELIGNPLSDAIVDAVKKDSKSLYHTFLNAKALTEPSQSEFHFTDQPKSHWVWRIEYRIRYDDGKWSDWGVWIRRPNVFTRKCDAERRIAKIQTRNNSLSFEFAVRPFYVGYDVREAKKKAKKAKQDMALAKAWAEQENDDGQRT